MKKIAKVALAFILLTVMLFALACNVEEWNYLHDNLDKSNATEEEFTEWMYKRTKTSIRIGRPNSEIRSNVELLMQYYEHLNDYIENERKEILSAKDKGEHLDNYDMLSFILEKYAKISVEDKIWMGKAWVDTGKSLNISANGDDMSYIANQIMARNKPIEDFYMYKEIKRGEVLDGEEIVSVVKDADNDLQTQHDNDVVEVRFKDSAQAKKIAQDFVQRAISARQEGTIGELYTLKCMYEFCNFIGYADAYVNVMEDVPSGDESGESGDIITQVTKVPLYTYYQNAYIEYVN